MNRPNGVQFAVVREDPRIEARVLATLPSPKRALLVASGGCTALSLATLAPSVECVLFDKNPAQLALVRAKESALRAGPPFATTFDVDDESASGLSQCGNFEGLFRGLRRHVFDFVAPYSAFRDAFTSGSEGPLDATFVADVVGHAFWPVGFEMFFGDPMLRTMFGPEAVQYAAPGSYPTYFREAFERGFRRPDARTNPFLHHVWLGHYLDRAGCLPTFLEPGARVPPRLRVFEGDFAAVTARIDEFDLVSLSNLFDWMGEAERRAVATRIVLEGKSGMAVVLRQLNNRSDVRSPFGPDFNWDESLGRELVSMDRSLFYERIHVGVKR